MPKAVGLGWRDTVEFTVEKFPFPTRERETIPVKYLQQTNNAIGGDAAMSSIEITARYAFSQKTAEALEKWHSLVANERTGGVGAASAVKTTGEFRWLIPNMTQQIADLKKSNTGPGENTLKVGALYHLEGCWIKSLKFSDADQTSGTEHAKILFSLQIDRYYPTDVNKLAVLTT